jgi:hypothetical protein
MESTTRDQQRILDQMSGKLNDKERAERDYNNAHDKLNRNSGDSMAARDLQRASEQIERINSDFERLKDQL